MTPSARAILHHLAKHDPAGCDLDALGSLGLDSLKRHLGGLVKAGQVVDRAGIYAITDDGRKVLAIAMPPPAPPPTAPVLPFLADQIVQRPLVALRVDANNARTHSEAQVSLLAAIIRSHGFTQPILIDPRNQIIAGHGRVQAARQLGLVQVPCILLPHLSDTQQRELVLADNRLAELAGWDDRMLKAELDAIEAESLADPGEAAARIGFSESDLAELEERIAAAAETTDPEPPPDAPASVSFDIVVTCGSAADRRRAMKAVKAAGFACHPFNKAS